MRVAQTPMRVGWVWEGAARRAPPAWTVSGSVSTHTRANFCARTATKNSATQSAGCGSLADARPGIDFLFYMNDGCQFVLVSPSVLSSSSNRSIKFLRDAVSSFTAIVSKRRLVSKKYGVPLVSPHIFRTWLNSQCPFLDSILCPNVILERKGR